MKNSHQISFISLAILLVLSACSSREVHIIKGSEEQADKLLIVDCLLPGQIKKLGRGSVFVTPRRPAKLTQAECEGRGGEYTAHAQANTASALKVWLGAAEKGDKIAQTYVGEIYEKGIGIEPDYKTAAHWYKRAAKQGHPRAKLNLGYMFEKGLGVRKNIKVALQLYREASGFGDSDVEYVSYVEFDPNDPSTLELRNLKTSLEAEKTQVAQLKESVLKKTKLLEDQQNILLSQQQDLFKQRQDLEDQLVATQKAQASANADKKKLRLQRLKLAKMKKHIESQLKDKELALKQQRQELAKLKAQGSQQASRDIPGQQDLKVAIASPSIHMVKPPLITVRGVPTVYIRPTTKTREIVGRVAAPAGVSKVRINNVEEKVDANGVFRRLMETNTKNTPVDIVVVDKHGQEANLEFRFIQDAKVKPRIVLPKTSGKEIKEAKSSFGNFYALVIGNNDYLHYPKLKTAVNDARKIADILSNQYGFKTTTLINANRYTILATINFLGKKMQKNDNFLIYYAGHGELNSKNVTGYWLPVDAKKNDRRNWIPNNAITDLLGTMKVKRAMIVADSCYSGALTRSAIAQVDPKTTGSTRLAWLRKMAKTKARTAFTSGGLKPVSDTGGGDHSVFAKAFIDSLSANTAILEGQRLYHLVRARMATTATAINQDQIPEYAPIRHAGHESGEFFFLRRRS